MPARIFAALAFLLTTLTSTTSAENAAPILNSRDAWQPGTSNLTCLFMTSETNWMGEQQNLCNHTGICSPLLPDGLSSNVSSAGPDQGQTCSLYDAINCTGNASDPISWPGYADLSAIAFDDRALSWRCYRWCGWQPEDQVNASGGSHGSNRGGHWSTTTTLITVTETASASANENVNAVETDGRVSISTTLSGTQRAETGSSSVTISTTHSSSASSSSTSQTSTRASTFGPLSNPPAPISDVSVSTTLSTSPSGTTISISTTETTGTSGTSLIPATSSPRFRPRMQPSSFIFPNASVHSILLTGTAAAIGNVPSASLDSFSTLWMTVTHTYGGRGGTWTTLLTVEIVSPVPSSSAVPERKR